MLKSFDEIAKQCHVQLISRNFSRTTVCKVGQGLIAGRKQLGPVKVVKPSLRGVTGSVTCKSQRERERERERENACQWPPLEGRGRGNGYNRDVRTEVRLLERYKRFYGS